MSQVVFPGTLLRYTKKGSHFGRYYLVVVRCRGKGNGLTKETCTFPVLVDIQTGYARKHTATPPKFVPRNDWRKHGMNLCDIVGSEYAKHYEDANLVARPTMEDGITIGKA